MDVFVDEPQDGETRLAYTIFMDAVDQLRAAKTILDETAMVEAAEKLIDNKFNVKNADVDRLGTALRNYREARSYFVSPNAHAALHASLCGLDGLAAVSKIRTECVLQFNSLLASNAIENFHASDA